MLKYRSFSSFFQALILALGGSSFSLASEFSLSQYQREFAVGGSYSRLSRANGPTNTFGMNSGELFGYYYRDLDKGWVLRPGLRLGYVSGQQPQGASAVSISESDVYSSTEVALLWKRRFVIPALTFGAGVVTRSTSLQVSGPVKDSSSISGTTYLPFIQGQLSGIIPLQENGLFEFAPFVRYTKVFSDSRYSWSAGVEVSLGFF